MTATTTVELTMPGELLERLDALDPGWSAHCRAEAADEIATVTARLGIPLRVEVVLHAGRAGSRALGVRVAGVFCRMRPPEQDWFRHLGRLGLPCYTAKPGHGGLLPVLVDGGRSREVATLMTGVAAGAVLDDAATLARPELAGPLPDAGRAVLSQVLRLGFRVDDWAWEALRDPDLADPRRAEALIDALAPTEWRIEANPAYLDALAAAAPVDPPLASLSEWLFTATGISMPRMVVLEDPTMPDFGFAMTYGGRRTAPLIGLAPHEVLVAQPDGAARDPLTGLPARVAHADDPGEPAAVTLPHEAFAALVTQVVLSRAASTVTTSSTAVELDLLSALTPALAAAAGDLLPEITAVRRALVDEGVNVRDMADLAQAVIDATVRDASRSPEALLASVRVTLAPTVVASTVREGETVRPQAVPPALLTARPDDEGAVERVAEYVEATIAAEEDAVFVVPGSARARLSEVIRRVRPTSHVLADEELRAVG